VFETRELIGGPGDGHHVEYDPDQGRFLVECLGLGYPYVPDPDSANDGRLYVVIDERWIDTRLQAEYLTNELDTFLRSPEARRRLRGARAREAA
jgi:hypothetical protein